VGSVEEVFFWLQAEDRSVMAERLDNLLPRKRKPPKKANWPDER